MGCDGFPKLGLGTWMMGGRDMPDPSNDDIEINFYLRLNATFVL